MKQFDEIVEVAKLQYNNYLKSYKDGKYEESLEYLRAADRALNNALEEVSMCRKKVSVEISLSKVKK